MGIERRQRCRSRYVCHPRAFGDRGRDLRNRVVGNAQENQLTLTGHGDPTLAQASRNGRADAAGTDDLDALEH